MTVLISSKSKEKIVAESFKRPIKIENKKKKGTKTQRRQQQHESLAIKEIANLY